MVGDVVVARRRRAAVAGSPRTSEFIGANAFWPLNASGASVVPSGPCWSTSENATTITASATATNPAR